MAPNYLPCGSCTQLPLCWPLMFSKHAKEPSHKAFAVSVPSDRNTFISDTLIAHTFTVFGSLLQCHLVRKPVLTPLMLTIPSSPLHPLMLLCLPSAFSLPSTGTWALEDSDFIMRTVTFSFISLLSGRANNRSSTEEPCMKGRPRNVQS